ncbi:unnamed protein product [Gordionus sp. m RMFG-2023]
MDDSSHDNIDKDAVLPIKSTISSFIGENCITEETTLEGREIEPELIASNSNETLETTIKKRRKRNRKKKNKMLPSTNVINASQLGTISDLSSPTMMVGNTKHSFFNKSHHKLRNYSNHQYYNQQQPHSNCECCFYTYCNCYTCLKNGPYQNRFFVNKRFYNYKVPPYLNNFNDRPPFDPHNSSNSILNKEIKSKIEDSATCSNSNDRINTNSLPMEGPENITSQIKDVDSESCNNSTLAMDLKIYYTEEELNRIKNVDHGSANNTAVKLNAEMKKDIHKNSDKSENDAIIKTRIDSHAEVTNNDFNLSHHGNNENNYRNRKRFLSGSSNFRPSRYCLSDQGRIHQNRLPRSSENDPISGNRHPFKPIDSNNRFPTGNIYPILPHTVPPPFFHKNAPPFLNKALNYFPYHPYHPFNPPHFHNFNPHRQQAIHQNPRKQHFPPRPHNPHVPFYHQPPHYDRFHWQPWYSNIGKNFVSKRGSSIKSSRHYLSEGKNDSLILPHMPPNQGDGLNDIQGPSDKRRYQLRGRSYPIKNNLKTGRRYDSGGDKRRKNIANSNSRYSLRNRLTIRRGTKRTDTSRNIHQPRGRHSAKRSRTQIMDKKTISESVKNTQRVGGKSTPIHHLDPLIENETILLRKEIAHAPKNDNEFLMQDHYTDEHGVIFTPSFDTTTHNGGYGLHNYPSHLDDSAASMGGLSAEEYEEELFLEKEFAEEYETARNQRLNSMTKAQLIQEVLYLEAQLEEREKTLIIMKIENDKKVSSNDGIDFDCL